MIKNRESQARLALATLAVLIGGATFLNISALLTDWGIVLWIVTVSLLCGSLVLFAFGERAPLPGEILLELGLVFAASFIFIFAVGGLYVRFPLENKPSFFTDPFINELFKLVNFVCFVLAILLLAMRLRAHTN